MKYKKVYTFLDLSVFFALFFAGLGIGQYISKHVTDIWAAYNGSVICVTLIGELMWWGIRKAVAEFSRVKKGHK